MSRRLAPGDRVEYVSEPWSHVRPGMIGRVVDVGDDEVVVAWDRLTCCHPPEDLRLLPREPD